MRFTNESLIKENAINGGLSFLEDEYNESLQRKKVGNRQIENANQSFIEKFYARFQGFSFFAVLNGIYHNGSTRFDSKFSFVATVIAVVCMGILIMVQALSVNDTLALSVFTEKDEINVWKQIDA
jgi:hypothetical protein